MAMLAAAMLLPAVASAQSYPTKPLRLIIPYSAGGPSDILARAVAQKLGDVIGQSVVAENRPSAGAIVAATSVARADPDGYTILFGDTIHTVNPALRKDLPYNALKDFDTVGMVAVSPLVLVVHPSVPAKNIKELIALARSQPGKLTFGSAGIGNPTHLAPELFKAAYDLDILHVPYKGAAPALVDVIGGRVSMVMLGVSGVAKHVQAGTVRALAITGTKRTPVLPDLPTFAEAGADHPDMEFRSWWGLLVPAGTPDPIVKTLNGALVKALRSPDLVERLGKLNIEPRTSTPEEFAKFMRSETTKWAQVIKRAGIQPE